MRLRWGKFSENLVQLLFQMIALDEKALEPAPTCKTPVPRQQKTPFGTGQTGSPAVLKLPAPLSVTCRVTGSFACS